MDTLLIDVSNSSSSIGWAKFSDGIQTDKGTVSELGSLVEYAVHYAVMVWIPAQSVTTTRLNIPKGQQRQLHRILPSLLEDNVASDIDDLHFISGGISAVGEVNIATIEREQLEFYLAQFHQVGLKPQVMLSAGLSVELTHDRCSLQIEGKTSVLRTAAQAYYYFDTENIALLLPMMVPNLTATLSLYMPEHKRNTVSIEHAAEWQGEPVSVLAQLPNKDTLAMNLLQGEYQPQNEINKYWTMWRSVVFIALAALAIQLLTVGIETIKLNKEATNYKKEIARVFHNTFPDEKRLVNPKAQMAQQLDKLQSQQGGAGFLILLQQLAPALKQAVKVTVTRINFESRQGEMRMDIQATDYTQLEQLKNAATKLGLNVELSSVSGNNGAYTAKLMVKSQ